MRKPIAIGTKFNFMTVVGTSDRVSGTHRYVRAQCVCGIIKEVQIEALRNQAIKSCGRCRQLKHGYGQTPIYYAWARMMSRCYNKRNASYARYGGRGITVCERWHDVSNFAEDMLPTFAKGLQLDRIDNAGNYEPPNCRWSTPKENARNRSSNVTLTYNGETLPLSVWAERIGISRESMWKRVKSGWSVERATQTPRCDSIAKAVQHTGNAR